MDLTEAEDIKKRWQEYKEKLTVQKRYLWTHSCDDSPRASCPGVWSQVGLRKHHYEHTMNKASEDDGIPAEL